MTEKLLVEFAPAEGAVLRLLGLVERRGFRVSGLGMSEQPCGKQASLSLDIVARDASRRIEVLGLQLQRVHGVSRVTHANACVREKAA